MSKVIDTKDFKKLLFSFSNDKIYNENKGDHELEVSGILKIEGMQKHIPSKKFTNLTILEFNEIKNVEIQYKLEFENCVFSSNTNVTKFKSLKGGILVFTNCTFKKGFEISYSELEEIVLIDCFFETELILFETKGVVKILQDKELKEHSCIEFIDAKGLAAELKNVNVKELFFMGSPLKQFTAFGGQYRRIEFVDSTDGSSSFRFSSSSREMQTIESLQMNGLNVSYNFTFNNVCIRKSWEGNSMSIMEGGSFVFQNITLEENSKISLANSDLNRFSFKSIDFSKCSHFNLLNSRIIGASFTNITWNDDYTIPIEWEISNVEQIRQKKEQYRQLKLISEKNSILVDKLGFYRNEMIEFRKYVKQSKVLKRRDRLLLWFDKNISDFGQNWTRPLFLYFFGGLIFFYLILLCGYKDYTFSLEKISWNGGVYVDLIRMLNPVHKMPEYNNAGAAIFDFLMRVSGSFFIYHFIRATRRYSKV